LGDNPFRLRALISAAPAERLSSSYGSGFLHFPDGLDFPKKEEGYLIGTPPLSATSLNKESDSFK
jgi:hypothetical protein